MLFLLFCRFFSFSFLFSLVFNSPFSVVGSRVLGLSERDQC